jgi:riboflavin kinase / FMN adenylyltransferase
MVVHHGYENIKFISPFVTMGIFDGVHLGHKSLLKRLVLKAEAEKGESVVITFNPHPRLVLQEKHTELSFLSTIEEKTELLREAGIAHLIIVGFNKSFSNISADEFIQKVLVGKLHMKYLIIGHDHHFGREGEGSFETIKQCSKSLNFIVEQVEGLKSSEGVVSSSSIRKALLNGKLDKANNWLGYNYFLNGKIVEGKKIGRDIGFPTANIEPDYEYKLIPADGVYAVIVRFEGIDFPGMLNIGINPTIDKSDGLRSIEVHIFNFDQNIYGREIKVSFIKRLRDEIKFDNIEDLKKQMYKDKEYTLGLLGLA